MWIRLGFENVYQDMNLAILREADQVPVMLLCSFSAHFSLEFDQSGMSSSMWSCLFFHLTLFSCMLLVMRTTISSKEFHLETRDSHLWKFFDWRSSLQAFSSLCNYIQVRHLKTSLRLDLTEATPCFFFLVHEHARATRNIVRCDRGSTLTPLFTPST